MTLHTPVSLMFSWYVPESLTWVKSSVCSSQKNAKAPLSVVFDNSPLEQMHISLLLRVMRHHGLGPLLDETTDASGQRLRKLLSDTVLATDMSVHSAFMHNFGALSTGKEVLELPRRQTLMCQAIIKAADIRNPVGTFRTLIRRSLTIPPVPTI